MLLTLSACSLAEDITPPPGLALTQTAVATAASPTTPEAKPDVAAGAAVYAQHCAACHGETGQGDGPLAAQVRGQLPDFTSPAWRRARAPQELFSTITAGRVAQTMPPFGDTLSPAERWNVTAYLYTLSAMPQANERGQTLYAQHCAACHGEGGRGDGPQAAGTLPDFTSPQFFAAKSETDFFAAITQGLASGAHTFADQLTDDERWAVADHVRTLGYSASPVVAPAPGGPGQVAVRGVVTNGTANAAVPDGLPVELYVFNTLAQVGAYTTTVSAGQYAFANVALEPQQALVVTLNYGGLRYTSEVVQAAGTETQFDLPVEIYETTTDPSVIGIARWHVFFNVGQPGKVQVGELLIVSNNGDRTFAPPTGTGTTLEILLPPGIENLQFQDQALAQRIQTMPSGFAYVGAVQPGAGSLSLLFSFDLPLARQLNFEQATRYPVSALNVLVPEGALRLRADQLAGPERQDVQGTPYLSYTGSALPAGGALSLTVTPTSAGLNLVWLVAGAVVLVALAGLGLWAGRRRARQSRLGADAFNPEQRRAELITAIAELDEAFEKGDYAEKDYRRRRATLKAEALKLITDGKRES